MPSPGRIQFNVSVEPEIKREFKKLCERENVSAASVIQAFLRRCIDKDILPTRNSYSEQIATHFTDSEIEVLKKLASNYEHNPLIPHSATISSKSSTSMSK